MNVIEALPTLRPPCQSLSDSKGVNGVNESKMVNAQYIKETPKMGKLNRRAP